MDGCVRLLMVGYGLRGRQWAWLSRRRRDVAVTTIVDPDPAALELASRSGLKAYEKLEDALAQAAFDGALIASPPAAHFAGAITCLRAGLGVLVEKPLALSLSDATLLADEATGAGRPALVVQNFRFLPRERAVTQVLARTEIGLPVRAVIQSSRALVAELPLWDFALHHLDALRIRFRDPPEAVRALRPDLTTATRVSAELRWANGVCVTYDHQDGATHYIYHERLECSGGVISVDDQVVTVQVPGRRARRARPRRAPRPDDVVLTEFLVALSGGPSTLTAADNLLTVATVEALILSAQRGEPVSVSSG
jgi:predicted dehydrogenase